MMQRNIEVYAHWEGLLEPTSMGILHTTRVRGKEIFSFSYNHHWLNSHHARMIDPSLQLLPGKQYAPNDQGNFGVFLDSSPDRWGRFLMNRREAVLARQENRPEIKLMESDYLLGVFDKHRIGALRFRIEPTGPFLDDNKALASPPWTSLRELEQASLSVEQKGAEQSPDYSKWIQMLIAPGGSLGGARPKASVVDEHDQLWIAKFPSINDQYNMGVWEMLACKLAQKAGIIMAEARAEKFYSQYHTFLNKRFDRTHQGERFHFASAMTLLQYKDGDDASIGASYLELAEFIMQHGENPTQDLEQLWRRIVFFVCISNVDDHLRNHGFILGSKGWKLSPAFDINPNPNGDGLKLNISESDNSQDLELVRGVAEYFRLKPSKADLIIQEVVEVVQSWRTVASSLKISSSEQNYMERAFRIAEMQN